MTTPKLLKNGTVLAFNEQTESIDVLRGASVLIIDDCIAAVDHDIELDIPEDTEVVDMTGKIVSSGFVDTHRHTWQTVYRALAPDIWFGEYMGWLGHMSSGVQHAFTAQDIYTSSLAGHCAALNAGVTTIVDHAHHNWAMEMVQPGLNAAVDSGARVFWCYDPQPRERITRSESYLMLEHTIRQHRNKTGLLPDLVSFGIVFDELSEVASQEVEHLKKFVKEMKLELITMHSLGKPWPIANNSPELAYSSSLLDGNTPVIFSHGGFVTETDRRILRETNHFLSITPESECQFGQGQKTSHAIQDQASLGLDTNWTFSDDMITQARIWLQLSRSVEYQRKLDAGQLPRGNPMSVQQAYLLATRHGGLALHRSDIGVLKVGAKADIIVFRGDEPHMVGWDNGDPVGAVLLHANVGDIEHVLVNGAFRKRDGKLLPDRAGVSWSDTSMKFAGTAGKIKRAMDRISRHVGDKFFDMVDYSEVEKVDTRGRRGSGGCCS